MRQMVAIVLSAMTVIVAAFALYVEQRQEFHMTAAKERDARRAEDTALRDEIADLRKEIISLLIEIGKSNDDTMTRMQDNLNARDDRQEQRSQLIINRVLDLMQRVLQLENPKQEVTR